MRNVFKILTVLALMTASACERLIVDWAPVNVYIQATDNDGNSIISDDMPGMSLTFKGEIYTVQPATKDYLARMEGLVAEKNAEGVFQLRFGEIDGSADMDEDLVLRWPDGSTDTIHYHCSDHKARRNPTCNRYWKLNGVDHDGAVFVFTGKSLAK